MLAKATEGAIMLPMASKRVKNAKWDDRETMLLAKLKREAFLQGEEGSHVWHDISQRISGRSAKQCRRRWDTLVKVYNHVQDYCTQTGQDHEELDDAELASMKLETAYRRDWYMIVQEVSSERKRRRICGLGAAAVLSKGSSTPVMETFLTTRPTTTDGPVITSPGSDSENIGKFLSRETPDFENHVGRVTISSGSLGSWVPSSPRRDTMASLWQFFDTKDELNPQVEQTWTVSERLLPTRSLSPECSRHDQGMLTFDCFSPPISFQVSFYSQDQRFFSENQIQEHQSKRRLRHPPWNLDESVLLAEMKREAIRQGEGGTKVWYVISLAISGRSAIQCRRRWETLVRVCHHVQDYCTETGKNYEELDDIEVNASMKLCTPYRRDWSIIVWDIWSLRKERRNCDRVAAATVTEQDIKQTNRGNSSYDTSGNN